MFWVVTLDSCFSFCLYRSLCLCHFSAAIPRSRWFATNANSSTNSTIRWSWQWKLLFTNEIRSIKRHTYNMCADSLLQQRHFYWHCIHFIHSSVNHNADLLPTPWMINNGRTVKSINNHLSNLAHFVTLFMHMENGWVFWSKVNNDKTFFERLLRKYGQTGELQFLKSLSHLFFHRFSDWRQCEKRSPDVTLKWNDRLCVPSLDSNFVHRLFTVIRTLEMASHPRQTLSKRWEHNNFRNNSFETHTVGNTFYHGTII